MRFIHLSPFYPLSLLKKMSTRKNEEHRLALNEGKQWHIPFWPDMEEKIWFSSYRHFIASPYHYRIAPSLGALKNQDNDICQLFMLSKKSFSDFSPHESLFLAKTRIVHCIVGIPLNGFSLSSDLTRSGLVRAIQRSCILENSGYSLISTYMSCTMLGLYMHYFIQFTPHLR